MVTLNGRIGRLESTLLPRLGNDHCRVCGLRHATGPMGIPLLRGILRIAGGVYAGAALRTPLCLCDPCCGTPSARWLARLSHGLPDEGAG